MWACAHYCFVVNVPRIDHTDHPYFDRFCAINASRGYQYFSRNVPHLRSVVSQYKMGRIRGMQSHISEAEFEYASGIRSIKAPEMRSRVRSALNPLGYYGTDKLGWLLCRHAEREFRVSVDFPGRLWQLRYVVAHPEFTKVSPPMQFGFESAMGLGGGNWDFIVEENVDEVFALFTEVVAYSAELPERIRRSVL